MFASAATAARPLATATTVTVATETRAVRDSESRTDMQGHAGFFVANAVLSRDPLSQGRLVADPTLPWLRGQRERDPPHQKRRRRLLSRTRGPDGSSWAPDACATRSNIRQAQRLETSKAGDTRSAQRPQTTR